MITEKEFWDRYPHDYACAQKLFDLKMGDATPCPQCGRIGLFKPIASTPSPRIFFCNCSYQISVTSDTILRGSAHLRSWFIAMFLISNYPEVKIKEIEKHCMTSHLTALRMRRIIRQALMDNTIPAIFD